MIPVTAAQPVIMAETVTAAALACAVSAAPGRLNAAADYPTWSHGVTLILKAHRLYQYIGVQSMLSRMVSVPIVDEPLTQAIIYNSCCQTYQRWLPKGDAITSRLYWNLLKEYTDSVLEPGSQKTFLPSLDTKAYRSAYDFATSFRALAESWTAESKGISDVLIKERWNVLTLHAWPRFFDSAECYDLKVQDVRSTDYDILRHVDTFASWAKKHNM